MHISIIFLSFLGLSIKIIIMFLLIQTADISYSDEIVVLCILHTDYNTVDTLSQIPFPKADNKNKKMAMFIYIYIYI